MNDGTCKKISNINIGDLLSDNNEVTACIKVETKGSIMYYLNGITVSDSHIVNYKDKWIPVSQHPSSNKYIFYGKPYLYCLNTTNKTIQINGHTFTDWDELYDKDFDEIKNNNIVCINKLKDIHTFLDGGFDGATQINLKNGTFKQIKDINIGDILYNNEKVYGLVTINGSTLDKQFKYCLRANLGDKLEGNLIFEGGQNLNICDKRVYCTSTLSLDTKDKIPIEKHNYLYHLLTDTKTFHIENIKFYDYNAAIDLFLEKNRGKLLSMKYV
jgi:hypothetical protein